MTWRALVLSGGGTTGEFQMTWAAALLVSCGVAVGTGCCPRSTQVTVVSSLRPVDSACPKVVFSAIQGEACGPDAVLGAIRNMKRLRDVDGYLEVVIETSGTGEERCAKATGHPFRYGDSTDAPSIRVGKEALEPVVEPGRGDRCRMRSTGGGEPGASGTVNRCQTRCAEVAALVEPAAIKRALVEDRCEQRCARNEEGFDVCIAEATTADAASACLAPAETPHTPELRDGPPGETR